MSTPYNTYPNIPPQTQTQPPNMPIQQTPETIPSNISSSFKRQNNDPILWFANPPLNVLPKSNPPVHSLEYLQYKQKQQQQKQEEQDEEQNEGQEGQEPSTSA
ncbi:unnamed protein product [Cunninghamella blakesleeana]